MEVPVANFSRADAVELAHALSGYLAETASIRALSIKGFTLERHGLRTPRDYADADIWVEPSRFDDFVELLRERGWTKRFERFVPHVLPEHSVTLIHPQWPCDIDVHWYFPGCFASADTAFESFWSQREASVIANVGVQIPNLEASAVIGFLHAARHPESKSHLNELAQLVNVTSGRSDESRRRIAELITDVKCASAIGEQTLLQAGVAAESDIDDEETVKAWHLHVESLKNGTTLSWLNALRSAPMRQKPAVLARAIYPTHDELERQSRTTLSWGAAWRVRLARLAKGLRAAPHALMVLLRQSKERRTR